MPKLRRLLARRGRVGAYPGGEGAGCRGRRVWQPFCFIRRHPLSLPASDREWENEEKFTLILAGRSLVTARLFNRHFERGRRNLTCPELQFSSPHYFSRIRLDFQNDSSWHG